MRQFSDPTYQFVRSHSMKITPKRSGGEYGGEGGGGEGGGGDGGMPGHDSLSSPASPHVQTEQQRRFVTQARSRGASPSPSRCAT